MVLQEVVILLKQKEHVKLILHVKNLGNTGILYVLNDLIMLYKNMRNIVLKNVIIIHYLIFYMEMVK